MGLLSKVIGSFRTKANEGEVRPGPWYLPLTGGWLSADAGSSLNWWQQGHNIHGFSPTALVEACISAYSQTVAMCPGDHWKSTDDGGRKRVTTSCLSRILRKPNEYQTISDFMLNMTRFLYAEGNAYALALRNNRYEIDSLHPMNPRYCLPYVAETGEVFYGLGGNPIIRRLIDIETLVPARDVLHIRLHTAASPRNMLLGESPIIAAARDIAANDAILGQQIQFYMNQARPSFVLSTDLQLDKDQVAALRERWDQQSRGLNQGGTPILTAGLKPMPIGGAGESSQLAEILKMTEEHVALAFRVPLQILGIGNAAAAGPTEALMRSWVASGLGFCLNHIEEAIGKTFELAGVPDEYVEFDTKALLRSAQKDEIDALARGVQGGLIAPNEGRAELGFKKVEYGDEPRVQQQVVPLSAAGAIPAAPSPDAPPSSPTFPAKLPPPQEPRGLSDEEFCRRVRSSYARELTPRYPQLPS